MSHRCSLVLAILIYVTLDLSLAGMPGAFVFELGDSVFKGGLLTVELSKLMGFSSERIFTCDLDTPQGQSIVQGLTLGAEPGSAAATPLWGLAQLVKEASTLSELRARYAALMAGH